MSPAVGGGSSDRPLPGSTSAGLEHAEQRSLPTLRIPLKGGLLREACDDGRAYPRDLFLLGFSERAQRLDTDRGELRNLTPGDGRDTAHVVALSEDSICMLRPVAVVGTASGRGIRASS